MVRTKLTNLEREVISKLETKGLISVSEAEYQNNPTRYGDEVILDMSRYLGIYNIEETCLLLISSSKNLVTRIICIQQNVGGTVDQKYPYFFRNCIERIQENHIIIVLEANGAKPEAVDWLKTKCMYETRKDIQVMNLDEFKIWVDTIF